MVRMQWCAVSLVAQAIFLALVLLVDEGKLLVFGLFWLATLSALWAILAARKWKHAEFIIFSALMAAILFAVLYASNSLLDPVGLGVPIIGLILVAALLAGSEIPQKAKPLRKTNHSTKFVGLPKNP